jgi:hypothetical protein
LQLITTNYQIIIHYNRATPQAPIMTICWQHKVTGTTTMQARLRCKRATMPPDPLDVALIVDENLTRKSYFAQNPLTPLSRFKCQIFIYGWIPIQKSRDMLAHLHLSLAACIIVVAQSNIQIYTNARFLRRRLIPRR